MFNTYLVLHKKMPESSKKYDSWYHSFDAFGLFIFSIWERSFHNQISTEFCVDINSHSYGHNYKLTVNKTLQFWNIKAFLHQWYTTLAVFVNTFNNLYSQCFSNSYFVWFESHWWVFCNQNFIWRKYNTYIYHEFIVILLIRDSCPKKDKHILQGVLPLKKSPLAVFWILPLQCSLTSYLIWPV